ncbi:hypothetical protein HD806DRAFT_496187 [Xylariaceae sp. AK1471]|nr:hypothetical protein HD806DRAFT_496187 [Xylariaceae sp. AK1471]
MPNWDIRKELDFENSLWSDSHNPTCLLHGLIMVAQSNHLDVISSTSMAPCGDWQTRLIDPAMQGSLPLLAIQGFESTDRVSTMGNTGSVQNAMLQSHNGYEDEAGFGQGYAWQLLPASGLGVGSPSSLEATPGFAHSSVHDNSLIRDHISEVGDNGRATSRGSGEVSVGDKEASRAKQTGVMKVFACFHEGCPFTASSRKDIRRHLQSDKHRKDQVYGSQSRGRFYCKVRSCKFAVRGFSRRDNFLRHMSNVHQIELERERSGRKAS